MSLTPLAKLVVLLGLSLTGHCALATATMPSRPFAFKQSPLDHYDPRITARETSEGHFGVGGIYTCDLHEIEIIGTDPINGLPRTLRIKDLYSNIAANPQQLPMIVLVPPIGGVSQLDTSYANEFCLLGFRVALIEDFDFENVFDIDLGSEDRNTARGVAAIRHTLEYLKPLRPHQLGLMGTSAGAIVGSIATNFDARISAAVLLAGGGHLADIISTSDLEQFAQLRTARMKAYAFPNLASYTQALQEHIQIDPLDFIGRTGPKRIWMMIAENDTTVPTRDQRDLYQAFGSQDLVTFNEPHVPAIVHTFIKYQSDIQRFFQQNLR